MDMQREVHRKPAKRMFQIALMQCAVLALLGAVEHGPAALLLLVMIFTQGLGSAVLLYLCRSAIPQAVRGMRTGDKTLLPPETKDEVFWLTATTSLQLGAVLMALLGAA